jgi:hypothetical protein
METMIPKLPHITEVESRSIKDEIIFNEIKDVLRKHKAESRFGLTLLHEHFDIAADEIQVEFTDSDTREQYLKVMKREDIAELPVIETSWRLDTNAIMTKCVCINFGDGHKHWER